MLSDSFESYFCKFFSIISTNWPFVLRNLNNETDQSNQLGRCFLFFILFFQILIKSSVILLIYSINGAEKNHW